MAPHRAFSRILFESIVIGLLLILFVYVVQFGLDIVGYPQPELPSECNSWDQYYQMEITIFLAGALFHMIAGYSGLTDRYVEEYYS